MKKLFFLLPVLFMAWSCLPDEIPDDAPETVPFVDVERYLGTWYEIASYPQIFEFGCNCVTATYGIKDNGDLSVFNRCTLFFPNGPQNNIFGSAIVVPNTGNAQLKVNFFGNPAAGADYWIIGLADDYTWALVSDPNRNTFWILHREPQPDEALIEELIDLAVSKGYNRNQIQRMNQGCE